MFGFYLFVVISIFLTIEYLIFAFALTRGERLIIYPAWLNEIMIGFYWFAFVYWFARLRVANDEKRSEYKEFIIEKTGVWFCVHVVSAYVFSFALLYQQPALVRYPVSYLGTFVLTMILPVLYYRYRFPRWQAKLESNQLSLSSLRKIALRCEDARRFVELFPSHRVFVYDNKVKNTVATCLLAHRTYRTERPDLQEEITLEIPIDIKKKRPVESGVKRSRYIFQTDDELGTVMHLHDTEQWDLHRSYDPLDQDTLRKFDTMINRFPSLRVTPFPLAVRKVPFEMIEID